MTLQQFISAGIEGGWKPFADEKVHKKFEIEEDGSPVFMTKVNVRRRHIADILLDPDLWRAVGKQSGWKIEKKHRRKYVVDFEDEAKTRHHRFLDLLWEGKTLLEALAESTV